MADIMNRSRGGGAIQVSNPVQPVGGTMGLQNANAVAITGGAISGVTTEPRSVVIYDPTPGVYSVDKFRLQADFSNLLRIPLQNTHPTGQVDFGVVSGPGAAGSYLKANSLGFIPGATDIAFHDYRSSNPAFQIERREQGSAIDRWDRSTNTYSLLRNTVISGGLSVQGGTNLNNTVISGGLSVQGGTNLNGGLNLSEDLDGLSRMVASNQNSGINARTDFVQQIGGSTARSSILGIRQIAGADTAFLDARGNLPFEHRLSFAENVWLAYRRTITNQASIQVGDSATEIGFNGGYIADYKAAFNAQANKHTALFRCPTGAGFSGLMVWNTSNGEVLKCLNNGTAFGGGNRLIAWTGGASKPITTGVTSDTIVVANSQPGDIAIVTATDNTIQPVLAVVATAGSVPFNSTAYNGKTAICHVTRYS